MPSSRASSRWLISGDASSIRRILERYSSLSRTRLCSIVEQTRLDTESARLATGACGPAGGLGLAQPLVEGLDQRVQEIGDHRALAHLDLGGEGHARGDARVLGDLLQVGLEVGNAADVVRPRGRA